MNVFSTTTDNKLTDGMLVLVENMEQLQSYQRTNLNDRFRDLFTEGIVLNDNGSLPFNIEEADTGKIRVRAGVCYIDTNGVLEKVAIIDDDALQIYNSSNPTQTTYNNKENVLTPKSTGCYNIPVPNDGVTYYVGIKYLQVCDNGNTGSGYATDHYSIKPVAGNVGGEQLFYSRIDGYEIVLQLTSVIENGFLLGSVVNSGGTLTIVNMVDELPIALPKNISIQPLSITTGLLADQAVTAQKIANKTITFAQIADGGITNDNIANATISGTKLQAETITGDKIADNAIGTTHIINKSVTTDKIADGAITIDKLASIIKTPFAINSGNVDVNGNGDILYYVDDTPILQFKVGGEYNPLVATNAKGISFELDSITDLDTTGYADGTYTVCIKKDQIVSELKGQVFVQPFAPVGNNGDLWYNTSVEGCICYEKVAGAWTTEYEGVPLGKIAIDAGILVEARTLKFNNNGYNVNFNIMGNTCGVTSSSIDNFITGTLGTVYDTGYIPVVLKYTYRSGTSGRAYTITISVSNDGTTWTSIRHCSVPLYDECNIVNIGAGLKFKVVATENSGYSMNYLIGQFEYAPLYSTRI